MTGNVSRTLSRLGASSPSLAPPRSPPRRRRLHKGRARRGRSATCSRSRPRPEPLRQLQQGRLLLLLLRRRRLRRGRLQPLHRRFGHVLRRLRRGRRHGPVALSAGLLLLLLLLDSGRSRGVLGATLRPLRPSHGGRWGGRGQSAVLRAGTYQVKLATSTIKDPQIEAHMVRIDYYVQSVKCH